MSVHRVEKSITTYNDVTCIHGTLFFNGVRMPGVNMYYTDGLLMDVGPLVFKEPLYDFYTKEKIEQIALTHIHEDHTGMAAWLKEKHNVPVYIHKDLVERASKREPLPPYRLQIWGERMGFSTTPMPDEIKTNRFTFKAIDAPGHHAIHKIFLEKEQGWLFSGDLFINIRQDVAYKSENVNNAITTIKEILKLDFETLFCYHAGIVEDGKKKFKEKLDYFTEFQETVRELRKKGMTDKEIDDKLFPRKHLITMLSEGEWSSINMVKTV